MTDEDIKDVLAAIADEPDARVQKLCDFYFPAGLPLEGKGLAGGLAVVKQGHDLNWFGFVNVSIFHKLLLVEMLESFM